MQKLQAKNISGQTAGANGSIITSGSEDGSQVVSFAEVSDPFYRRLLIPTFRKRTKKKHEEEVLFSMCEICHSQFDKFSPRRWMTQATGFLFWFFSLMLDHWVALSRCTRIVVAGSLLTSYWPSRSDRSSNQQQQPGPRQAYRNAKIMRTNGLVPCSNLDL